MGDVFRGGNQNVIATIDSKKVSTQEFVNYVNQLNLNEEQIKNLSKTDLIEQILSENGDDRRRMFEEAAGINKYRKQRKSTLRKFDATRFDLERINDVISEVEQKVHGLALQLKRFKRHEKLTLDLREKDMQLAFLRVDKSRGIMNPLQQEIKDFNHLKSSKTDQSSSFWSSCILPPFLFLKISFLIYSLAYFQ